MGTNYYVKTDPCPCCGRGKDQLHIGKSSGGWKFVFAPYPEHGLTSWAAWKAFLADKSIQDEYGRDRTLGELNTLIEAKQAKGICFETATREQWGSSSREGETKDAEGYWFANRADFS